MRKVNKVVAGRARKGKRQEEREEVEKGKRPEEREGGRGEESGLRKGKRRGKGRG